MGERQKQHMGRSTGDEHPIRGRDVAADDVESGDGARASEAAPQGGAAAAASEEGASERSQGRGTGR